MTAEELATSLGGFRSGRGWSACCPAHDDRRPSLSINDGDNGRPVFYCFAGCPASDIISALKERGLWDGTKSLPPDNLEKARMVAERDRAQAIVSETAAGLWDFFKPAPKSHGYLVAKKIKPWMAKVDRVGRLVVPVCEDLAILTLQFISPWGDKSFLKGGRVSGGYLIFNDKASSREVVITESFSNAASIAEVFGDDRQVVASFGAGNILSVAKKYRALGDNRKIIIAADNDINGVGQKKAIEAAKATDSLVAIPQKPGYDWNDVFVEMGPGQVGLELGCLIKP